MWFGLQTVDILNHGPAFLRQEHIMYQTKCPHSTNRLQHHSAKGHHDTLYGSMMLPFKGNPNFQDIVNWILQILHYYCRKQDKNIKNSWIIQQSLVLSFHFSLFTATCASCCLPQRQNFFISWTKYFTNFKRHKWSFVLYIVSFSGFKMIFTITQLEIIACIKNCVYNDLNLHYFMCSITERLQISLL